MKINFNYRTVIASTGAHAPVPQSDARGSAVIASVAKQSRDCFVRLCRPRNDDKGFTLSELMVSVGITTILSYCTYLALSANNVQTQTVDYKMAIQDSAREGVYKMVQELRLSAPARITFTGSGASTTTGPAIQFFIPDTASPVTAAYAVDWAAADQVQYALGGTDNKQIIRTINGGNSTVIANDVTSLTFTGNAATPSTNVVTVTMNVQKQLTNGRNVPSSPLQVTAKAELRNT